MPREEERYTVGDYWLGKRRDGKSPIWQIAHYHAATRQVRYRSTHKRDLDDAKSVIHAHVEELRAKRPQTDEARVIPQLVLFWKEAGQHKVNAEQTELSLKLFIGFLLQDEIGMNAAIADLTPMVFTRFRDWRLKPHQCAVPWRGTEWTFTSPGVVGATIDRNLNDIRSALHHAEAERRVPYAPKVAALESKYKSKRRDRELSLAELGKIYWYASHSPDTFRWFALMLATGARPEAALAFDPSRQFIARRNLIDTQPDEAPETKKRNAVLPAIRPLRPILRSWANDPRQSAKSRKTAWRIMRRVMGFGPDVLPKTVRHTVASILYSDASVPERQVSELLGHTGKLARTTSIYAHYDPTRLRDAERALSKLFLAVRREAFAFCAVHLLSTTGQGGKLVLARHDDKA